MRPFMLKQFRSWLALNWSVLRGAPMHWRRPYGRMHRLYRREDPWRLTAPRERERFALTNALIARHVPDCGALLEIGSGEGGQTAELRKVARHVTGIEVSEAAVARARLLVPDAEFFVGCGEDAPRLLGPRRFDLVTACEMLYYAPDPAGLLDTLRTLAPRILVTVYDKRARGLARHLRGPGWARLDDIMVEGVRWHCHFWQANAAED